MSDQPPVPTAARPPVAHPSFAAAVRTFGSIGLLSFGGPAGQIAVMHRILVEDKKWIDEGRFLHALNYCMLLPGPEAMQLATYFGWLLHGWRGGLMAGVLFVLPGFLTVLALAALYALYQDVGAVAAVFFGLKAAVLAIVVQAAVRLGRRVLKHAATAAIAIAALVAIYAFAVPFPVIVGGAALIGLLGGAARPAWFTATGGHATPSDVIAADARPPRVGRAVGVAALWLALWWLPVAAMAVVLGRHHVFTTEGVFFSKAAVVTFGGAYAVLGYIAQQAVERYGWLLPHEMLDGLGLAETTPGPLILVVEFVGFLAAYRAPGSLPPLVAGVLGALITVWVTFVPCFLWIFVGAPWVERLRSVRRLSHALTAITAAVVGVLVNLALWFSVGVLFRDQRVVTGPLGLELALPDPASVDLRALAIAAAAGVLLFGFKRSPLVTALAGMVLGLLLGLLDPG
jgi:chromate transporter